MKSHCMASTLRKSGIEIIGDVPWGTHFCQFYQTQQDLLDTLVPYFTAGLTSNEFCMWVTAEPLGVEEAIQALRECVPDLDLRLAKGQIEIIPHTDWYLLDGTFDQDRVLDGWVQKLDNALIRGYEGLRLTGNTFWLEKDDWQDFTDYEEAINNVIGSYRMLALCTYSIDKCGAGEIADVISNHEFAMMKRFGEWTVIESSTVKQAKRALEAANEELAASAEELEATNAELLAAEDELRSEIEERRQAEKNLQKQNRIMTVANVIMELFVKESGNDLYDKALDAMLEAMESKHGVFGYMDEQGILVCPTMSKLLDQCEVGGKCIHYPRDKWKGLWANALLEGRTLYSNEPSIVPKGHVPIRRHIATPILFHGNIIGLLNLANKEIDYTEEDREFIEAVTDRIAPVLFAWIQRELRENERALVDRQKEDLYQREHRIAEVLQEALIPTQIPTRVGGCTFSARYLPAFSEAAVGGDFYDVFDLGDGKVGVLIGDIAGKGLQAAMQVSAIRYAIRSYAFLDPKPSSVVTLANEALCRSSDDFGMLTAFFAVVDTTTSLITYTNAGHEPPIIREANGRITETNTGGRALGVMGGFEYTEAVRKLEPGDAVVMVTDGITEARTPEKGMLGKTGLMAYVAETDGRSPDDLAGGLLEAAREHAGGNLQDDVAIVVLGLEGTMDISAEDCSSTTER